MALLTTPARVYTFDVSKMYRGLVLPRFEFSNTTNNDNNIDYGFKETSDNDFLMTNESLSTTVASVSTRQMQDIDSIANKMYTTIQIPEAYRIDAKPYIERPFYAGSVKFPTSATRYSWLQSPIKRLPGDVIRSNLALLNAMKIGSLYRADMVLNISMAGTITHAGCVLVSVLPPLNTYPNTVAGDVRTINTFLSSPHAFLYANEATSVNLTVPWYCNTDLATLNMDLVTETTMDLNTVTGNYGTLAFMVLNPLKPSTGSSIELTIVIEACFKNLDILVPTPRFATWTAQSGMVKGLVDTTKKGLKMVTGDFIDKGINSLFGLIGLHNPNVADVKERDIITVRNFPNLVDSEQHFEKLDPYANYNRIVNSPVYGSDIDEMALSHITSKRQMLGAFSVTTQDAVGKLYWIRPISPFQGGINGIEIESECANNLELLHSLHRAWRGDLKIIITSVMNNKQQCKLKLLKMYNPPKNALTTIPTYQSIANAPSHLMEFTQGGQEHEIVLPFLSRNEIMPCSENLNFEAFAHGLYYVYLAQPLANSDGSPTSIEFNIFMEGTPNLTFYGYTTKNLVTEAFPFPSSFNPRQSIPEVSDVLSDFAKSSKEIKEIGLLRSADLVSDLEIGKLRKFMDEEFDKWSSKGKSETSDDEEKFWDAQVGDIKVMNQPQVQKGNATFDNKSANAVYVDRLQSNLDIRPLVRRMYIGSTDTLSIPPLTAKTYQFNLASILAEQLPTQVTLQTPISAIANMYYGKNVGFKICIQIQRFKENPAATSSSQDFRVYYIPPGLTFENTNLTICGMNVNPTAIDLQALPQYGLFTPFQVQPVRETSEAFYFEFVIPDVTYFKYMGSPNKMSAGNTYSPLATADFGNIYVMAMNNTAELEILNKIVFTVGLTDESRMGHHAMATVFKIIKIWSPYLEVDGSFPTGIRNPNIYKGAFL